MATYRPVCTVKGPSGHPNPKEHIVVVGFGDHASTAARWTLAEVVGCDGTMDRRKAAFRQLGAYPLPQCIVRDTGGSPLSPPHVGHLRTSTSAPPLTSCPSRPTVQRTRQLRRGRTTPATPPATACSTLHGRSGRRLSGL
jgi:hypothetical protein